MNLGAGFDSRFSRVDNGKIHWFDLDLPDAIADRKKVFPDQDRVTMLAGSALESDWCAEVQKVLAGRKAKPVFLAEGLFMYFTLDQIKTLLLVLRDNFPMICPALSTKTLSPQPNLVAVPGFAKNQEMLTE